jgi:hypothetical protein
MSGSKKMRYVFPVSYIFYNDTAEHKQRYRGGEEARND